VRLASGRYFDSLEGGNGSKSIELSDFMGKVEGMEEIQLQRGNGNGGIRCFCANGDLPIP
jgi:hypothetical protein